MKTIFKSYITNGLTLSLLCLGGSMQAKSLVRPSAPVRPSVLIKPSAIIRPSAPAPVATLFQKKSIFAAHPVLTCGGISLATGALVFALIELRRGRNSGKGFVGQIRADYKSVIGFIKSKMSKKNSVATTKSETKAAAANAPATEKQSEAKKQTSAATSSSSSESTTTQAAPAVEQTVAASTSSSAAATTTTATAPAATNETVPAQATQA